MKTTGVVPEALAASISRFSRSDIAAMSTLLRSDERAPSRHLSITGQGWHGSPEIASVPVPGLVPRRWSAASPAPCPGGADDARVHAMNRADAWRAKGKHFSWSPRTGNASEVEVFHVELGDVGAPAFVLVHGFPTSSIDWFDLAELLSSRYRVCALDFPGFGFSDKPLGWGYSLAR